MPDVPGRIWIDLDQMSIGYTTVPSEATPHDTAFVPADLFDQLRGAVRLMRAAQSAYFRTRGRDALIRSKEAERAVDDMLNRLELKP